MRFDLLARLSLLDLIRGLPKLKFEKDLVCHPCHHKKMVAVSQPPVTEVMTWDLVMDYEDATLARKTISTS